MIVISYIFLLMSSAAAPISPGGAFCQKMIICSRIFDELSQNLMKQKTKLTPKTYAFLVMSSCVCCNRHLCHRLNYTLVDS